MKCRRRTNKLKREAKSRKRGEQKFPRKDTCFLVKIHTHCRFLSKQMASILPSQHFRQFSHSSIFSIRINFKNNSIFFLLQNRQNILIFINLIWTLFFLGEFLETVCGFFSFFLAFCVVIMAQLLSPVCTDTLKFQNPLQRLCSRNRCPVLGKNSLSWSSHGGRRKGVGRVRVASQESASYEEVADDYYAVLGLLPDATPEQIKKAYYNCMKACHPDLSGDDPETTNFCMFINEVYEILSDPVQRMVYDEIHGYALTAINPFLDDSSRKDHVFVDEFSCIGCKNCANVCSDVFAIEEDFGRARAYSQCGRSDKVQQAVESCPVDCIHWTSAAQLSLLEDEMRRVERVNVALMLSGMGSASVDVFRLASTRWEKRQAKVLQQAKMRMVKQKDSDKNATYWSNLWGKQKDYENSEEEVKERAARAAAAARRWREYSRRGVDKPPTFKLPEALSNKEQ